MQQQCALLLYIVVAQCAALFKLLPGKHKSLLIDRYAPRPFNNHLHHGILAVVRAGSDFHDCGISQIPEVLGWRFPKEFEVPVYMITVQDNGASKN